MPVANGVRMRPVACQKDSLSIAGVLIYAASRESLRETQPGGTTMNVRVTLAAILPLRRDRLHRRLSYGKDNPSEIPARGQKELQGFGWGQLSQDRGKQHIWLHE